MITRTYYVTVEAESEEEAWDVLEHTPDDKLEYCDEQVELIDTQYACF
jgi:hypothetical protein